MTKEMNLNKGANIASLSSTPTSAKTASESLSTIKKLQEQLSQAQRALEIDRRARDQAYYFILSSGNFKKFKEFSKKHPATIDYHEACLAQIYLDSLTTK